MRAVALRKVAAHAEFEKHALAGRRGQKTTDLYTFEFNKQPIQNVALFL